MNEETTQDFDEVDTGIEQAQRASTIISSSVGWKKKTLALCVLISFFLGVLQKVCSEIGVTFNYTDRWWFHILKLVSETIDELDGSVTRGG